MLESLKTERNRSLLHNVSFITLLQIFNVIAPLITYPYLVRVLGRELYGVFITAQVLVAYFSLFVVWGSDNVCAKHVSIFRDDRLRLSEIFTAVLLARACVWIAGLLVFIGIVVALPAYREYFVLFLLTYGMTVYDVLFPQYLFQGLEKMKYATFVVVGVKLLFILLVFAVVREQADFYLVPLLYSVGYFLGGVASLYIIFSLIGLRLVKIHGTDVWVLMKDAFPVFLSDMITTIKDRFNVLLMGGCIGMADVVTYDLALKINLLMTKPTEIMRIALFPRAAKNRNIPMVKKSLLYSFFITTSLVILVNLVLPYVVKFFLDAEVELLPIRLFTIAPILLSVSVLIAFNVFIAFGYNKYVLNSILITTICYVVLIVGCAVFHQLDTLLIFVLISLLSYLTEFVYRVIKFRKIAGQLA